MIGSRIVSEARTKGHTVVRAGRKAPEITLALIHSVAVDASDATSLRSALTETKAPHGMTMGFDVVVVALGPSRDSADKGPKLVETYKVIVEACSNSSSSSSGGGASSKGEGKTGPRVVFVGGANSLTAPGGGLPPAVTDEALQHSEALAYLKGQTALAEWTYLSPPAMIAPGERTGKYRLGKDDMVADEDGKASISVEDFAVALVDEIDEPKHTGERFTVGY
jgi:putative NADH-flavin reductase